MYLVNCENYNAIKITKDNHELFNDDDAPFVYQTTGDELICSLKEVPYCYVGYKDGTLFCNRVRTPIDFDNCCMNEGIDDLAVYGEIIDEDMEFSTEVKWLHENGHPFDNITPRKPSEYPIDTEETPDWDMVDSLDVDEIMFLLSLKMSNYETWYPEEGDRYSKYGGHAKYCVVGMTYYCD